ncbi:MAG: hypothetical protein KKD44_02935 [Proteobacteria bacterium]|nr:hypothetical protein [Pseudomonadota bacterium]
MKKSVAYVMVFVLLGIFLVSCGMNKDDDKTLQNNGSLSTDEYANFKLLDIFDGRGSVEVIWDSIDGSECNSRLVCTVDQVVDEFVLSTSIWSEIFKNDKQSVAKLLSVDAVHLLGIMKDEAPYFKESPEDIDAFYSQSPAFLADHFYAFLDRLWEDDNTAGEQALADIAYKLVSRTLAKKTPLEILADIQDDMDDIEDDMFDRDFHNSSSFLGKLLIQADYPLWVDDNGAPVDRDSIDPSLDTNTGQGNAVDGINKLVNWVNRIVADDEAREDLYGMIREFVRVFDPAPDSTHSRTIKALLQNLEDNFTVGGSVYESNPMYKSGPDDPIYTDASLKQTLRESCPYIAQMLARTDREISQSFTDENETPQYIIREMIRGMKSVGYDPDKVSIEEGIRMVMQYDLYGRDRTLPNSGAYSASMFESIAFLTGVTTHIGFKDGGETGETTIISNPTTQHGHGEFTGSLSINDALINMSSNKTLGIGLYDVTFKENDKDYLSRSVVPFTTETMNSYQYDFDQNCGFLKSLAGNCAGDAGSPEGGNRVGIAPAKNEYAPYDPTGLGMPQLAGWTTNWVLRSCFGGQGPYYYADPDAPIVTVNGKNYFKYLRPDGRVYALVNKDNETWEYLYPTDGTRDKEDLETDILEDYNGLRQRFNRYKSTWFTDYYMYHRNNMILSLDNSNGNLEMVNLDDGDSAGRLTYHELVPEDESSHMRACSSPEEAFFRNYEWVYTEKKMAIIVPQSVTVPVLGYGLVFMVLEAHGWAGLQNLRIFEDNHVWAKKGSDGVSDIPGDYRVEIVSNATTLVSVMVNDNSVYNSMLGTGNACPSIVGSSMPALVRLAFPKSPLTDRGNSVADVLVGSRDFEVGDDIWKNRNPFAQLFVSMSYAIDKHRVSSENYDPKSLKAALLAHLKNLAPLIKPQMYYEKHGEGCTPPYDTWKVRVAGGTSSEPWYGSDYLHPAVGFDGTPRWDGTEAERYFYQPAPAKTLLNVMVDSDSTAPVSEGKRMDGMLPILTETKTITQLLKVLMSDANDCDELYIALEQIFGTMKFTEGQLTAINRQAESGNRLPFPDWMFAIGLGADEFGFYTEFTNVRPEDIVVDVGLDRMIGHDSYDDGEFHEGYGLAYYVDDQEKKGWTDFDKDMDTLEDFLYPDSHYSVVEPVIDLIDAIFRRDSLYSNDDIAGFLYTLGKLFTRYDSNQNRWVIQGETELNDLYTIIKQRIPEIHDEIKDETGDNYHAIYTMNQDVLSRMNACGTSNGIVPYVLDAMSTDKGAEKIISDLHAFLTDGIISNPEPLWSTLADLLSDLSRAVDQSKDGELLDSVYEDYGFQRN